MDYDTNNSDEDFEDDEDTKISTHTYKASYIVVAIDTHPSMFQQDKNGRLPFRNCLEACLRILDSLIFVKNSKSWNPFSILLTREDPVFIDFGDNIIVSVKLLKTKLELSDQELEDEFQRKNDFDLSEFFLQCKKAFHDIKAAFYQRRLIYISNDDNPVKDAQAKYAAINEVKSFDGSQITFQIIPTKVEFNYALLYNEMLALLESNEKRPDECCTDVEGLEQKLSAVLIPKYYKRKVHFYPFKDDMNRFLTCFDFKLLQSRNLLNKKVSVEGKTVKPKPPPILENLPSYSIKTQKKVKPDVSFDIMEKDRFYDTSFPRGYTLVYIGKPILELMYCFSKPRLLQAHSTETTNFFRKFWQYCVDNDRVLICVVKYKQPAKIKFCQMGPIIVGDVPSFLCKEIPYGNNIKPIPVVLSPKIEDNAEQEELVRKMVNKLTIEFHPDMIPNPKYRKKMQYVKSKLLKESFEEKIELFDKSSLDGHVEREVEHLKQAFGIKNYHSSDSKRKRPSSQAHASKKKKNRK